MKPSRAKVVGIYVYKRKDIGEIMQITGTIVYTDVEGGFWGIEGKDGQKYRPVDGIPANFQQEGLQITAKISPADVMSIFMWGHNVNLINIDTL